MASFSNTIYGGDEIHTEISLDDLDLSAVEEFIRYLQEDLEKRFPEEMFNALTEEWHPSAMGEILRTHCVVLVSRLGPIRNNQLIIRTSLFAPDPSEQDPYDPVGEVVRWYPDLATDNYSHRLGLAHDRKLLQFKNFLEKKNK